MLFLNMNIYTQWRRSTRESGATATCQAACHGSDWQTYGNWSTKFYLETSRL